MLGIHGGWSEPMAGKYYGYWDVTRSVNFTCGIGSFAQHRNLSAGLHVTGGGGSWLV
jgi:hypothetical protein